MPVLDLPSPQTAGATNRRPETVTNTPYLKSIEDGRSRYKYNDGFYHTATTYVTNPVLEREKQEFYRHAQRLIDQFNKVAHVLQRVDPHWENPESLVPVIEQFLGSLIAYPFSRIGMEATADGSLLVRADLNQKAVFIDFAIDPDFDEGYEFVVTAYQDGTKTPLVAAAGPLAFVMERLLSV